MPIYILTRRQLAADAAMRWKQQYYNEKTNKWLYNAEKKVIYDNLVALEDKQDVKEVERIIGNTSWTSLVCDNCKQPCEAAIQIGELRNYESHTAILCAPCLDRAVKITHGYERDDSILPEV